MITLRHTTLGRTPLDESSARLRDLYLTTHHTQNRQTCKPPAGFEPTIPASEWPQTQALDHAVTGTGDIPNTKTWHVSNNINLPSHTQDLPALHKENNKQDKCLANYSNNNF